MDARFRTIAALAADQHSVVSLEQLIRAGVTASMRSRWVSTGMLDRLGSRSFLIGGAALTWRGRLTADVFDHNGTAYVAGRTGAVLMGLDGFRGEPRELLSHRDGRGRQQGSPIARTTRSPIPRTDLQRIDGLWVVRAERLIVDAPLFDFTRAETENAIDSAIRLRLVSEQRLRTRVIADHRSSVNGSRMLLDALVDTGGESRLERWFLALCREGGLPRPITQKVYRQGSRTVARVDAEFIDGLVVEAEGHGTHSTRQQRQSDEQRRTALTLRGKRVIVFTYGDVKFRPQWVASQIRTALQHAA